MQHAALKFIEDHKLFDILIKKEEYSQKLAQKYTAKRGETDFGIK